MRKRHALSPVSSSTRRSSTRGARTSIGPGSGDQRAGLGVSVAHDQAMPVLVDLVDQARDVAVDLGLEGGGQHPPRTLGHQLVQRRSTAPRPRPPQHVLSTSAFLPAGVSTAGELVLVKQEGTPRLRSGGAGVDVVAVDPSPKFQA